MIRDGKRPKIGPTAGTLGARIPSDLPEQDGLVAPSTGRMSVACSWRDIRYYRIPVRFKHLEPSAAGKNPHLSLWRMGEGPFVAGEVTDKLRLRPDSDTHALVEPSDLMSSEEIEVVRKVGRLALERIARISENTIRLIVDIQSMCSTAVTPRGDPTAWDAVKERFFQAEERSRDDSESAA